ncbi:MAG: ureidoglycolate lyase [Casimicrobiaceae bacterium]
MNAIAPANYLAPDVPGELPWHDVPLVRATEQSLRGYGHLVDDHRDYPIEIVTWPQPGWRSIDPGTGDEGGTTSGLFDFWWEGETMFGRNAAVASNSYLLGWSRNPCELQPAAHASNASPDHSHILLWHANYHPDGGQLFFPLRGESFVCPLALPGDDVRPEHFIAFVVEEGKGLYIHPNVWHEAVFPLAERAQFHDEQGKVHARISCNIAQEFGVFLRVPLYAPG